MPALTTAPFFDSAVSPLTEPWLGAWENSADCAYCRDTAGHLIAANLSFARKFGRAAAALAETTVADFLHADDLPAMQAANGELLRPPHRTTSQHRWRTPQGVRWFAWEETALKDAAGAIVAIRAVGRDITRQRLAEEQFYRLSRAVEQSPVSIVITDLDGRAQYVNSKFIAVTGHTLEDILDQNIEVLRDGHPNEDSYRNFWATVRAGEEWRGELVTQRGENKTVWESVKVSCLRNPAGEITNFLCLREDVTERKILEQSLRQAQKMESLGTLAGGIAHDFNNLLAIINGYAEFCQQTTPEPAQLNKSLREIHRAAQRASGLVRQILTFSRKTEVKFLPVDLNQIARELGSLLSETFPRSVAIQLNLFDALPPLLADQSQVHQIVLNFCVNARDAMPSGGTITLTTSTHSGSSLAHLGADPMLNYARLAVSDTGTGMTPEVRARIFEPFFTTKPVNQGTGLGLAVVYGIVTAHHGFLDVESAPGMGSTFSVYLPLADTDSAAPTAATAHEALARGTESLLIVDDEDSLRELLAATFSRQGYRAETAATGDEAIGLVQDLSRKYDAVLLDLNMPGAGGLEVLKVIKQVRPRAVTLVISGHITPDVRREFEHLGHRDFVQKPYRLDDIGRQLRTLLAARGSA